MGSDGCAVCGDPLDPGFECSYCGTRHCTAHRLPESHGCPGDLQAPTTATATSESDSDSNTPRQKTADREDPATRMERVTTASPRSTTGGADENISDPREPTFEASSPDLNPDGSLVADGTADSESHDRPHASDQLSVTHRLYYKLRATVRAPFGLLREYAIPLLVIGILVAVAVGVLISA